MSDWSKYLTYNKDTGRLFWKDRTGEVNDNGRIGKWTSQFSGKEAGHKSADGYLMVGVRGKLMGAHRLIWEMMVGPIPSGMKIDHINGDKLDNRLCNLRVATHGQNRSNSKPSGKTGLKGVCQERHKFRAQLRTGGRLISVGTYSTKGLAAVAYAKASLKHHGVFSPFYRKQAIGNNLAQT